MRKLVILYIQKYIASPRKEWFRFDSVFMVAGIILSVSVLTISTSIFEGYEKALKESILGTNAHVYCFKRGDPELTKDDVEILENFSQKQSEIVAYAPGIITQAMIVSQSRIKGTMVNGIDWRRNHQPTNYKNFIIEGTYELKEKNDIVLGSKLANQLQLTVRDSVQLISPINSQVTAFGIQNKSDWFNVVGIYRSGMHEYDSKYSFVNFEKAMDFASLEEEYTIFAIKLASPFIEKADYLAYQWEAELGGKFQISSWIDFNGNLFALLTLEKWVLFIILSFLILIASFNVVSAVSTSILDKRKEIAILKTCGASHRIIRHIFVGRTMYLSLIAILSGQMLGYFLSWILTKQNFIRLKGDVYFLDQINMSINGRNSFLIFGVALLIVWIAASLPLKKITNINIQENIR